MRMATNVLTRTVVSALVLTTAWMSAGCSDEPPTGDDAPAEVTLDDSTALSRRARRRLGTGGANAGAPSNTAGTPAAEAPGGAGAGGAPASSAGGAASDPAPPSPASGSANVAGAPAAGSPSAGGSPSAAGGPGGAGAPSAAGSTAVPSAPRGDRSPIGTNLGEITDYTPEWSFVDAMKGSRGWMSGTADVWDDGRVLPVDANGWVTALAPGQIARTLMFWDLDGHYPLGQYVVLYDGKGTLRYSAGATKNTAASSPGRDVLQVGVGGISLEIAAIDAQDPLRNVRVIMPGGVCSNDRFRACDATNACAAGASCNSFESNYATQIFHPTFLERIKSYGLIRFMDWGRTNNSSQRTWSERPKVADARYSTKGAPVEIMVELANRLSADPWFTLPHQADDAYVAAYARVIAQKLAPGLKAHVEHSNEVWNSMFSQANYASARGAALGLSSDPFEAQLMYHAKRSVEMFQIFEREFGGRDRLVRVLAAQASNAWTSNVILGFQSAASKADAVAVAPYFAGELGTPEEAGAIRGMNADQLLDHIAKQSLPMAIGWIKEQAEVASAHGVRLIAYEGGQHLAGFGGVQDDESLNTLFDAVNRHARMKALYATYLDAWRDSGGELFTHYISCGGFSRWGRWGALEHMQQSRAQAPKYDAIQSFIETNAVWW